MISLIRDRSYEIKHTKQVPFTFNGEELIGYKNESLAIALLRAGKLSLRNAPSDGKPRGMFCCMGLCQECVICIDGAIVESCRYMVTENLVAQSVKYTSLSPLVNTHE